MMRGIVCGTLVGIVSLSACSSETSEPLSRGDPEAAVILPDRGCAPAEPPGSIPSLICTLLPTPMDRSQLARFRAIQAAFDAGDVSGAQSDMLSFIDFIAKLNRLGELEDPNGSLPPTIPQALSDLSQALLAAVGFGDTEIPPDAYDKGFVGVVNGAEGGMAIAKNAFYGVEIPPGSFTGEALVVLDPLPNGSDPLFTDDVQVPKFVEIQSVPQIESFEPLLTVGVCAITDGLTEAQEAALRLAHNVAEGVEVVDFVQPPFDLDCEALIGEETPRGRSGIPDGRFNSQPRLAATRTKGVGGQVSSFSPFGAVVPTSGRDLVFASDRDGNLEIYSMQSDGSDVQRITNDPSPDDKPELSPDGTRIVFRRFVESNSEILVMDADGSNIINLTNHPALDTEPSWSPDGSEICFTRFRDEPVGVFKMDAEGGNVVRLANGFSCTWSPTGDRIAFTSGTLDIFVMNADGSDPVNLTRGSGFDFRPDWSPDGSKIAFDRTDEDNADVFVMNADGSNQTNLTSSSGIFDAGPKWLTDGSKILFETLRKSNLEILQMNPDGTGKTNVTNNPSNDYTGGPTF